MPPRGTLARCPRDFAQRLGAGSPASRPLAEGGARFFLAPCPVARHSHRIVHRAGTRGTVWTEHGTAASGFLCVAGGLSIIERRIVITSSTKRADDLQKAAQAYAAALGVK